MVHEQLENKISALANKVDKLQEENKDLRERQEEIEIDHNIIPAKDDKVLSKETLNEDTPPSVREGDGERVATGNKVPSNEKASEASDHVMKDKVEGAAGNVNKSPEHVIKLPSPDDPKQLDKVNKEKAEDKNVIADNDQAEGPVGVAKDVGVVNPAGDEVKSVIDEIKNDPEQSQHDNEAGHLGAGRDLKRSVLT